MTQRPVRHLLQGRTTNRPPLTEGIANTVLFTLRQRTEISDGFLVPGKAPELTFIRTLLEQSGDEHDIAEKAAQQLLRGEPAPAQSALTTVRAEAEADADQPAIELVPSLREVVEREGLDARKLSVALIADERGRIHLPDRHEISVMDGRKIGVWRVPSLRALCRGSQAPSPVLAQYPAEYDRYFYAVEKHVLIYSETQGVPTDQELESIYGSLRRRPDGKCLLGPTQEFLWQAAALTLGMYVLSEAEYLAIMGRLERSARTWAWRPVSRNYVSYLRENLPG